MMNKFKGGVAALFVTVCLPGCVLVPFVNAFKQAGVVEGDRMALLAPEVKKFSDGLVWGSKSQALSVVLDESRAEISHQLKDLGEDERVVESKISDVEWADNAHKATVTISFKVYRVPYYVVKTRREAHTWVFSMTHGWRLKERDVVTEG